MSSAARKTAGLMSVRRRTAILIKSSSLSDFPVTTRPKRSSLCAEMERSYNSTATRFLSAAATVVLFVS
ncbi:MAG TPA: hypothetical protein DEP23_12005 [Ruminococcaceae bacterium]|nr:hypothetical protein [Oscillospiraceae bacterium]